MVRAAVVFLVLLDIKVSQGWVAAIPLVEVNASLGKCNACDVSLVEVQVLKLQHLREVAHQLAVDIRSAYH